MRSRIVEVFMRLYSQGRNGGNMEGTLTTEEIKKTVKEYILAEFLPGEDPEELTESTPLIMGGILDSLATLKLVAFLEERYKIELQAHEIDEEHMNHISDIATLVRSKLLGELEGECQWLRIRQL